MRRADCIAFLRHLLPRLGFCWAGYRRVHRTVCKRLARRLRIGGLMVLGAKERLPDRVEGFVPVTAGLPVYRRRS